MYVIFTVQQVSAFGGGGGGGGGGNSQCKTSIYSHLVIILILLNIPLIRRVNVIREISAEYVCSKTATVHELSYKIAVTINEYELQSYQRASA